MAGFAETHPIVVSVLASSLVSAVVSGVIGFFNNHLDRKQRSKDAEVERNARRELQEAEREARRREQLLLFAMKLAERRTETVIRAAERSNRSATLYDEVFNVEGYYQALDELAKTGALPAAFAAYHREAIEARANQRRNRREDDVTSSVVDGDAGAPLADD